MATANVNPGPASLLGITIRRSITIGRTYLIVGSIISLIYSIILSAASGSGFGTALPILIPVLTVVGGIGALVVFTNDRVKGVFEYLVAYGISPRRLFVNVLVASMVLVTIVLAISLSGAIAVGIVLGNSASIGFLELVFLYSIPMTYAASAFAATVGMYWSSLSSPRVGMNSPIGLVPLIAVGPPLLAFIASTAVGAVAGDGYVWVVLAVALLGVAAAVLVLLSLIGRLLPLERLLSPA